MIYTARYEEINKVYFRSNRKRIFACGIFAVINALAHAIAPVCGNGDEQRSALKAFCGADLAFNATAFCGALADSRVCRGFVCV